MIDLYISTIGRWVIYRDLAQQIRKAIACGELRPDEKLPSVRKLASKLKINPNTVARAYTELQREGLLTSRRGGAVKVAQPRADLTRNGRDKILSELIDNCLMEAVCLGYYADQFLRLAAERAKAFHWPGDGEREAEVARFRNEIRG